MKRLIALLLLAPALASASGGTCGYQACVDLGFATSGSLSVIDGGASWNASGAGFSIQADMVWPSGQTSLSFKNPFFPGADVTDSVGVESPPESFVNLVTFGGVLYGNVPGPESFANGGLEWVSGPITHAGSWPGTFTLDVEALVNPENSASYTLFEYQGRGTGVFDVVPDTYHNCQDCLTVDHATFTFQTPEPSTVSLLLIAFAGLAVVSCRRRSRVTSLPAG